MTRYDAVCTDCSWTFESAEYESAADALERHSRKEQHHVEFVRQAVEAAA